MSDPAIWREVVNKISVQAFNLKPDLILGIESRGFIAGASVATKIGKGFIPVRKKGKLPGNIISQDYNLEYGQDSLEIQTDLIKRKSKIMIIDDVLATGGTASAAGKLIKEAGGILLGYGFLVELTKLSGRKQLDSNLLIKSVIKY